MLVHPRKRNGELLGFDGIDVLKKRSVDVARFVSAQNLDHFNPPKLGDEKKYLLES